MPIFSEHLPQQEKQFPVYTLKELVGVLPESIPFQDKIWVTGKLVRFGISGENILFVTDAPVTQELNMFFCNLVGQLGVFATVKDDWRSHKFQALRLYQDGELIIDKATLEYKKIPTHTKDIVLVTTDEIRKKLPPTIPWNYEIYLTGGVVKHGWSANDIDIMVLEPIETRELFKIKSFFAEILGWPTDVGRDFIPNKEPIYLFKIYRNGQLC
jgi:hypothetical protein